MAQTLERSRIFDEIDAERRKQDAKWGGAEHDDKHSTDDWFDEIRRQMFKVEEETPDDSYDREAFVKIAALSVAAIESHDRKQQTGPAA